MNPNGFVAAASMRLPDVDAEVVGEHRQLVDERHVDVAERVLDELGQLGDARRSDPDRLGNERGVERVHTIEA